jgi:hypothetical protein
MPLSEHEQRLLEQMEQALYAEDPKFATSLRSNSSGRASRGRAALGVIVFLVGIATLLGGAIVPLIPLGVAGFAIMVLGALLAYLGLRPGPAVAQTQAEASGDAASGEQAAPGRPSKAKPAGGFMDRLEDRWQRRREQGPGQDL